MMDHRDLKSARELLLCRAPLLIATAIIRLLNGFNLFRLMTTEALRPSTWEAASNELLAADFVAHPRELLRRE